MAAFCIAFKAVSGYNQASARSGSEGAMKSLKIALVLGTALIAVLTFWAYAQVDLAAMEAGTANLRAELTGQMGSWDATATAVEGAQTAAAAADTYQADYDLLMQAKTTLGAYSERLNGYLKDAVQYQIDNPGMTPAEADRVSRIIDAADSLMLLVDGMLMRLQSIEETQARLLGQAEGTSEQAKPVCTSSGDISVLTGNGTFADYDRHRIYLKQTYKDVDDNYFTFWEEYDNDHSFLDLRRMDVGSSQSIADFYNGELNLRERYTTYHDSTFGTNSRKQLTLHTDYTYDFNERTQAQAMWDYKSKNFTLPVSRSYLYHHAELNATHMLSDKVTGYAFWNMYDYHFSQGDAAGNNATNLGVEFEFTPTPQWIWNLGYMTTERSYDVNKGNAFFDDKFTLGARFQPDVISFGEAALELRHRDQRRTALLDFDDNRLKLRYWRDFGNEIDGDFRLEFRDKDYSAPNGNSYDYWRWAMMFNYSPDYNTRLYYNFDYYDYDYEGLTRSYDRAYNRVGMNYNWDSGVALTTELGYTDQDYAINTGRDYVIWDFLADLYWPFEERQSLRFYLDWSDLSQSLPGSINDYCAYSFGVDYDWRIDARYKLTLAYDYNMRDYTNQPKIKDQTIEARLHFDF